MMLTQYLVTVINLRDQEQQRRSGDAVEDRGKDERLDRVDANEIKQTYQHRQDDDTIKPARSCRVGETGEVEAGNLIRLKDYSRIEWRLIDHRRLRQQNEGLEGETISDLVYRRRNCPEHTMHSFWSS